MGYLFDDTVYFIRTVAPWFLIPANIIAILLIILTRKPKRGAHYSLPESRTHDPIEMEPQSKVVVG